jgi:uncharacterized protein YneF (UPF0154 family)
MEMLILMTAGAVLMFLLGIVVGYFFGRDDA